jgi:hypothetical protein
MIFKKFLISALTVSPLIYFNAACGEKGDSNDDADPTNTQQIRGGQGASSSDAIPTIDFTIPEITTGLELNSTASETSVLEEWADRSERIISQVNNVLERLNSDKLAIPGSFTGKGPAQSMSGIIAAASNAEYDYEALVCVNKEPALVIKWKTDQSSIYFARDYSKNPLAESLAPELIAEGYFTQADGIKNLKLNGHGKPWIKPLLIIDGDYLAQYIDAKIDADNTFVMNGVNNWYESELVAGEADAYLTGKIESDGTGQYVAYRKFNTILCPNAFDEESQEASQWCLGRELGSSQSYTDEQRSAAWEALKDYGIAQKSELKTVSLSSELSCP